MLIIYSPAGTEGMFADMHALTREQLMDAELTKQIALKHDSAMLEHGKDVVYSAGFPDVPHVDDRETFREHVPHIGKTAMHHQLDAVGSTTLVAMADQSHVAGVVWFRQVTHL